MTVRASRLQDSTPPPDQATPTRLRPLLVDMATAASLLGLSRAAFYPLVMSRAIPSIKLGARRLIAVVDLEAFVERQRAAQAPEARP
jgi:excisionase family DNA binding protein